ncbi:MAG: cytidyltransferase [Bacteroidetes bacterium GWC2_33_15]|nr:MAG: cytidyltransferase [Bacteroidetes bacterium GWA2_33_15]OFX52590.1 MAG: cytidyltransferase [Bacteroidetes bacterium GWC2_33_15]OFX63935.1 MAG: cytidyltransferase [Bacteroidetes bacterium GWB2_32_14]OFX70798.1 MAG: cytidyltransferase [Bacteroidetes bacterium GWD2_33_33]HAN19926.1 cytidyltransferase [Bacteroidales bacterium]
MKKVAIIPLRAGSKGIVGKNKKPILGRPLFCWILGEAIESLLDEIYIYTDDQWILDFIKNEYSWTQKVKGLKRSDESASDTASTEFAMLEFAEKINCNFEAIFLLQATSPLTSYNDINEACNLIETKQYDSIVSVVKTHRFTWSNKGESLNYNYLNRPRRQDFDGLLIENGAIYACNKETFIKNQNRLGGKIGILAMSEETLTEIDEESDMLIIEKLLENKLKRNKQNKKIKYLVLDVDGVFTDGTVGYTKDGESFKSFSVIDGMGLEILRNNHIIPVVITSENSDIVKSRMKKLNIEHYYPGIKDKYSFLNNLIQKLNTDRSEIAYIGDDINDLANICASAWGFCPGNSIPLVKQYADLVLQNKGSEQAIREAVEFILKLNNRYN